MKKFAENDLRVWLSNHIEENFVRIEPGYGSTAGQADVVLDCALAGHRGKIALPIELKVWDLGKSGRARVRIRPSQFRYHILEARAGRPTAFLVAVINRRMMSVEIYLFAGKRLLQSPMTGELHEMKFLGVVEVDETKEEWIFYDKLCAYRLGQAIKQILGDYGLYPIEQRMNA